MGQSQKHPFSLAARDLDEILRHAAVDLEAMRGAHLYITGGTGFFGKWLLAALLHANDALELGLRLTVLSRDPVRFRQRFPEVENRAITFTTGNVADVGGEGVRCDFVVHAATDTTAFTSDADERERSRAIVTGTRRLLEFARAAGARKFLNISSGAVYGAASGQRSGASEDDYENGHAVTAYGIAKREAEAACVASEVETVTARAFAFLGPYLPLDAHFAAGNFLRDALRGGPVLVRGDGTALRSYLYPTDLIVWLVRLLVRGERGRAYNVGSDEAVSTAQLARLMADMVEPRAEVVIQASQPTGPQNIYLPDVTRARRELALDIAVPLQDAIARTLEFLRRV